RIGGHTSIGVVATNLAFDKASAERVAIMAQDGYARAIRPVHTPMDGDTIFVRSTGRLKPTVPLPLAVARVGSLAADCIARAVARAVHAAD
ncbi:P1 family peptidase, partial [Acinetobacter baumannii]